MGENSFGGFTPPTSNFFKMPNEWTDITADIDNLAELKVVEYVLRHTWGFQEYGIAKAISVDEFMHGRKRQDGSRLDKGTKLSEQSVRNGLAKAIEDGFLECEVNIRDKARIQKSYKLKMQGVQDLEGVKTLDPLKVRGPKSRPRSTKSLASDSQTLDPGVPNVRPRTEKETSERHLEKNTEERETPVVEPEQPAPEPVPLSPSSLLEQLTEEQDAFWRRWSGFIGCDDTALTEKLLPDIVWLAERITSIADLESLHQSCSAMLLALSKSKGTPYTPPHLRNLVKHYATWKSAQDAKQREREQASTKTVSGSGQVTNWTQARLAGKAPSVVYPPVERPKKPVGNGMDIGAELAALRKRLSQKA